VWWENRFAALKFRRFMATLAVGIEEAIVAHRLPALDDDLPKGELIVPQVDFVDLGLPFYDDDRPSLFMERSHASRTWHARYKALFGRPEFRGAYDLLYHGRSWVSQHLIGRGHGAGRDWPCVWMDE
jgi:hypothetical protein